MRMEFVQLSGREMLQFKSLEKIRFAERGFWGHFKHPSRRTRTNFHSRLLRSRWWAPNITHQYYKQQNVYRHIPSTGIATCPPRGFPAEERWREVRLWKYTKNHSFRSRRGRRTPMHHISRHTTHGYPIYSIFTHVRILAWIWRPTAKQEAEKIMRLYCELRVRWMRHIMFTSANCTAQQSKSWKKASLQSPDEAILFSVTKPSKHVYFEIIAQRLSKLYLRGMTSTAGEHRRRDRKTLRYFSTQKRRFWGKYCNHKMSENANDCLQSYPWSCWQLCQRTDSWTTVFARVSPKNMRTQLDSVEAQAERFAIFCKEKWKLS